jgi:hypothetical protein
MDIRCIFLNQCRTFERWGDAVECVHHGDGYPCSLVGLVWQENPPDTYSLAGEEWRRNPKLTELSCCQEKPLVSLTLTVPQTDTGRQVEDTKACEITLVKELGNLTP